MIIKKLQPNVKPKLTEAKKTEIEVGNETVEAEEISGSQQIYAVLDETLRLNLQQRKHFKKPEFYNVCFVSEAGYGKTSTIYKWAKDRGIFLVDHKAGSLEATDFEGNMMPDTEEKIMKTYANTKFDALDKPGKVIKDGQEVEGKWTVLFLDEYNAGKYNARRVLLTLIADHTLPDPRAEKWQAGSATRYLPHFLFTVAAINPASGGYAGVLELEDAEKNRFAFYYIAPSNKDALKYILNDWLPEQAAHEGEDISGDFGDFDIGDDHALDIKIKRIRALATKLLTSDDFRFDSAADMAQSEGDREQRPGLTYRSFNKVLWASDGLKNKLIELWPHYIGPEKLNKIKTILANYKDVEDTATKGLKSADEIKAEQEKQDAEAKRKAERKAKMQKDAESGNAGYGKAARNNTGSAVADLLSKNGIEL